MTAIKVRALNAGDIKTVASILGKHADKVMALTAAPSKDETDAEKQERLGKAIAVLLLQHCLNDIWGWLADLAQMTEDELNKASIKAPSLILKGVYEDKEFSDFFGELQGWYLKAVGEPKSE